MENKSKTPQQKKIKSNDGNKVSKPVKTKSSKGFPEKPKDQKEGPVNSCRTNIEVVVRIRPESLSESNNTKHRRIVEPLTDEILVFDPKQEKEDFFYHGKKMRSRHDFDKRPNKDQTFAFDHVYGPRISNKEIFDTSMRKIVNHIIEGFNCSIFAYGATGAGKTFTMLGTNDSPGLSYLMAIELFNRTKQLVNEFESEVVVSYMEIYNEKIRDLLEPSGSLCIREDPFTGVQIPNLTSHIPKDAADLLNMLRYGNDLRSQHPTDRNSESSRSHAIFQVYLSLREKYSNPICMRKAKLVMVDLAGSEKGGAANCEEARFREGANINKSLFALGNCINALADGKGHVPYRDSKLTRILKDSLGGNCKTVMIANLSPSSLCHDDSYNTLKYADRAKEIQVQLKVNILNVTRENSVPFQNHLKELKEQVDSLTKQLKREKKTSEKLKLQLEEIPATTTDIVKSSTAVKDPSSTVRVSPLSDPVALEKFITILEKKKHLDLNHVSASSTAREAEFDSRWKTWRINSVKTLEKAGKALYVGLNKWKSQCETLKLHELNFRGRATLTKTVLNYNERQIDNKIKNYLKGVSLDDPFITVTLREFVHFKTLEKEMLMHTILENHHRKLSLSMFKELMRNEALLWKLLKYEKNIYKALQGFKGLTKGMEKTRSEIMAQVYGLKPCKPEKAQPSSHTGSATENFPDEATHDAFFEFLRAPVVDYEPPSSCSSSDNEDDSEEDNLILVSNGQPNEYQLRYTGSNTSLDNTDEGKDKPSARQRRKLKQKYEKKIREVYRTVSAFPDDSNLSLQMIMKGTGLRFSSKNLESELMSINTNFKPKVHTNDVPHSNSEGLRGSSKNEKSKSHDEAVSIIKQMRHSSLPSPISRTSLVSRASSEKSKCEKTRVDASSFSARLPSPSTQSLSLRNNPSDNKNNNTDEQFSEAFSSSESNTSIYSLTSIGSGGCEYYASLPTLSSAPRNYREYEAQERTLPSTSLRRRNSTPPSFSRPMDAAFKKVTTQGSIERLYTSDCSFISSTNNSPRLSTKGNKNGHNSSRSINKNDGRLTHRVSDSRQSQHSV